MNRSLFLLTLSWAAFGCSSPEDPEPVYECGDVYHHCSLEYGCRLCMICTAVDGPCSYTVCTTPNCNESAFCDEIPGANCDTTTGLCQLTPATTTCESDLDCGFAAESGVVPVPTHSRYSPYHCTDQGTCAPPPRHCKPTKCYEDDEAQPCEGDAQCDPTWEWCNLYTGYCTFRFCHFSEHEQDQYFRCPIGYHCVPTEETTALCDHEGCTAGVCESRDPCERDFDCPDPDLPYCSEGQCQSTHAE